MPVSVIDIPVNDEQFKAFLALFAKWRDQVKEMPGVWSEQSDQVGAIAVGFAAMTAALAEQMALIAKQEEAEKRLAKQAKDAADAKKKADKEQEVRDREAAARRKRALDDAKDFAKTVAGAVVDLGKWTLLGGAAGVVGGALSFWGLDRFVAGVGEERRTAGGLGVTTGERQALNVNMQRYFDVNSVMQNLQQAQADPAQRWKFNSLGINPTGKDPAELAVEAATAAVKIFRQGGGNYQWAQARGLLDIFSYQDLTRLSRLQPGELEGAAAKYRRDATGRFALSDDVNRKWQDFIVNLDTASTSLKNKLVDKLTDLEQPLSNIMAKFTDLGLKVLDRIDFDKLGNGIDKFSQYIGSEKFQKDFKTFIDDVGILAGKLVRALQLLGLIPDAAPPPGAPKPGLPGSTGRDDPRGYYTHDIWGNPHWHPPDKPMFGGGTGDVGTAGGAFGVDLFGEGAGVTPPADGQAAGGRTTPAGPAGKAGLSRTGKAAVDYLIAHGVNSQIALGVGAGITAEGGTTTAFNPGGGGHGALGIEQLRGDRQAAFLRRYGGSLSFNDQMAYLLADLRGQDPGGPAVMGARSADEAAYMYVHRLMRPKKGYETDRDDAAARRALHRSLRRHRPPEVIIKPVGVSVATQANAAASG